MPTRLSYPVSAFKSDFRKVPRPGLKVLAGVYCEGPEQSISNCFLKGLRAGLRITHAG